MTVSIAIATHGDKKWAKLAEGRAYPSALEQDALEVVLWHEDNGTLASARNATAQAAAGDWLCFLDGDDELDPGYLDAMRATMRFWNLARPGDLRDNPLLLVPAVEYVPSRGAVPSIPDWGRSLIDLNCAVIGTLIPRRLFLELGGFRDLSSLEDWDLWIRAVKAGARMVPVTDAIYRAFVGTGTRNADQSPYHGLRAEHRPGFDWANVAAYKVER